MIGFQIPHCHFCRYSEAKTCLAKRRVAFVGDSRIRHLFYSFIKIIDPGQREDGNKVCCGTDSAFDYEKLLCFKYFELSL